MSIKVFEVIDRACSKAFPGERMKTREQFGHAQRKVIGYPKQPLFHRSNKIVRCEKNLKVTNWSEVGNKEDLTKL